MAKRTVTRIGDIFSITIDGEYKVYFQYVAKDTTQLTSSVIRIFKRKYALDDNPDLEDVVLSEVNFYAHAFISWDIKENVWEKVGKSKNLGDVENIHFRLTGDTMQVIKSYRWYVWKINTPFVTVGELTNETRKYDMGWIVPPFQIVHKIKTGSYTIGDNIL